MKRYCLPVIIFRTASICAAVALLVVIKATTPPAATYAASDAPPQTFRLNGVVRDFQSTHSDFGLLAGTGHHAQNVAPQLGGNGLPVFQSSGFAVSGQFQDQDGNNIMPYGTFGDDFGLVGGHFDVDVFDAASTKKRYHKHEFDDAFDTNNIDIANDRNLLFDSIAGSHPNPLRVEMINTDKAGAGRFYFQADGPLQSGSTEYGLTAEFAAADLQQFSVHFVSLSVMNKSEPKKSQSDVVDRDGSFAVRLYDAVTDELVYEISAYHHVKFSKSGEIEHDHGHDRDDAPSSWSPEPRETVDSCGVTQNDTPGVYGAPGSGEVTSNNSFNDWYSDNPATNVSSTHAVELDRAPDGIYEFTTSDFFPVNGKGYGNQGNANNNSFTYTATSDFQYDACQGQFIDFQSHDDAWLFINGQLVIDLGGTSSQYAQHISLDRLGLTDGEEYEFKLFYAHRRDSDDAMFSLRTNVYMGSKPVVLPTAMMYD